MSTPDNPAVVRLIDAEAEIDDILDSLSEDSEIDSLDLAEFYDELITRLTSFRQGL